ncbi:MAG: sensor histidine kinase [Clostridium sp.]|uniref:sensor histidine kinase n=1 Tax=Clostridium sp. TaxID=1506 RepID=UPI003F2DF7A5
MIILVFILGIVVVILLSYIIFMKKEIKNISKQLDEYNNHEVDKKLDINLINKEIEVLAESINKHIDVSKEMKLEEVRRKEELKEMISNISHDLRTPLTSIIGYVQVIKLKNEKDEKKKEYLDKIEKRAKDLKKMLDDFFRLSVVENESYKIELEKINLSNIVCNKIVDFYDDFKNLGIEPNIKVEEEVWCLGNISETERILENILSNALKNTTGQVSVELGYNKDYAELIVSNSKSDKEFIDATKVFNRFYKGNDNSRRGKNTGIGLSIVKEVVRKMNGNIKATVCDNRFELNCRFKRVE